MVCVTRSGPEIEDDGEDEEKDEFYSSVEPKYSGAEPKARQHNMALITCEKTPTPYRP